MSLRAGVTHPQSAPDQDRDLTELVVGSAHMFEKGIGADFKTNCEKRYAQYRNFQSFKAAWISGDEDRDEVLHEAKKDWGANLHIPLSFRTIETMVPRAVAQRPKLLYLPRKPEFEMNTQNVQVLIDAQQENIDIDLAFQAVMRSGRIYGLGIGKSYWQTKTAVRRPVVERTFKVGSFVPSPKLETVKVFDDPFFEDVDVFDFMWDPYGSSIETCQWVIHRVWLSTQQVMERIRTGVWNTETAQKLEVAELEGMGSGKKYDEVWDKRMQASGLGGYNTDRATLPHEVLEFHDGQRVLSVLDRQATVQEGENPCLGVKGFQAYRPTPLQKQMVGIGDLEPLEHLQRELDTLRSQRRDAATIALSAGFAYDDGAIEEDDLVFGPNAAIRVTNANPSNALMPLQVRDVPGSGYQEESIIRQDFDAIPGLTDALDNRPGGTASTATEAQLVQAALGARIELSSRRFEIEVVRGVAQAFLKLNQRMILADRDPVRLPEEGMDPEQAAREGRWRWFDVGPLGLRGEWAIIPEGGSMAARNVPQDRQDAMQMMQMFGQNPHIDPKKPLMQALKLFGVKEPESWLKQQAPPIPPAALEVLAQMGVDQRLIQRAVEVAQASDPQLNPEAEPEQQGPGVQDVNQMMGVADGE